MQHRIREHEEEVPIFNSIKEGTRCSKNLKCWFRHPKPSTHVVESHVPSQNISSKKQLGTNATNHQVFWKDHPKLKPPNQMQQMMDMLKLVITEVSQLKQQMNIQKIVIE